ncbi:TIM barrel protein, partial [Allgaiera indica]
MSQRYRFSANTGFLWKDRPFLERLSAAAAAGFEALEFHDEAQSEDPGALAGALAACGLPVLGLNMRMGDTAGCAADPARADAARRDIDAALEVATRIGAGAVHVLAGRVAADPAAKAAYKAALRHALEAGDRVILIEPICHAAIPGYFLHSLDQALRILREIDHPRLKIMFDCYHIETEHGDVAARLRGCVADVGHVQIASVPGRAEPETGAGATLDYARLLPQIVAAGYGGAFGCEYRPAGTVEA